MVLKAKLFHIFLSFRILTHSLLRGLRWAVLRAWTQNHPKVIGPGHHPQPIGRNRVFEIERPEPPFFLRNKDKLSTVSLPAMGVTLMHVAGYSTT